MTCILTDRSDAHPVLVVGRPAVPRRRLLPAQSAGQVPVGLVHTHTHRFFDGLDGLLYVDCASWVTGEVGKQADRPNLFIGWPEQVPQT